MKVSKDLLTAENNTLKEQVKELEKKLNEKNISLNYQSDEANKYSNQIEELHKVFDLKNVQREVTNKWGGKETLNLVSRLFLFVTEEK